MKNMTLLQLKVTVKIKIILNNNAGKSLTKKYYYDCTQENGVFQQDYYFLLFKNIVHLTIFDTWREKKLKMMGKISNSNLICKIENFANSFYFFKVSHSQVTVILIAHR